MNGLFLYVAIDNVFHPSGIIQNGRRKLLYKSHGQSFNYIMKLFVDFKAKYNWKCPRFKRFLKCANGKGQKYNGSKQSWARTKNCTYFLYPIYFLITPIVHCVPGSWTNYNISRTIVPYLYKLYYSTLILWQYRLWRFLGRQYWKGVWLKTDCSQIKLLNFENWASL